MLSVVRASSLFIASIAAMVSVSGCNNCEKMVDKVCSDLGPTDCALWKEHGLDESLVPGGRKVNSACGTMMGDGVYPGVLKGVRQQIEGLRKAEQIKAKAGKP